jgi:hypothetical protein
MNTFLDIGLAILFGLLKSKKIPAAYVAGLKKLRDALNIAFPGDGEELGAGFKVTK